MRKIAKISTIVAVSLSALAWLLGVLFFSLNVTRCWEMWQGVGFLLVCYAPVPAAVQIASAVLSVLSRQRRYMTVNAISLIISVGIALLTALVSVNYG